MRYKLLIIGPFPGPPKGISLSNQVVADGLFQRNWIIKKINTEHSDEVNGAIGDFSLEKLVFLKNYFQSFKIVTTDVVYITTGITFFGVLKYAPFILAAKMLNKKTIVHVHSNHLKKEYQSLRGIKRNVFAALIASFDSGIALSHSLKDNLTPFLDADAIYELYNFVEDKVLLSEAEILYKKDFSEIRLFFLSNLLKEKGINLLLQVIKRLNEEGLFIKVKIAGNKIADNNLDDLLAELSNVEYLGIVSGTAKQDLLIWGNVFCLPTFFSMEGQPISILEAMAFNALILTTKHAGIPDICSDENAVFCVENSEEDLYLKLKFIVSNWSELQKKGVTNGVYAREKFTETKFIAALEDIILETIRK